jgi:hypothetical protein
MDSNHFRDRIEKSIYQACEQFQERDLNQRKDLDLLEIEKSIERIKVATKFCVFLVLITTLYAVYMVLSE